MRSPTRSVFVSLGLALAVGTVQAAGTVEVSYVNPDKFADIGWSPQDRDVNLQQLTKHFEALANRYLADGQKLNIDVLNVDLAGEERPSARLIGQELRVLNGRADWPQINLRYTLESAGQAARSGEVKVADMNYSRHVPRAEASEPLHAERRMLDEWFATTFGPGSVK